MGAKPNDFWLRILLPIFVFGVFVSEVSQRIYGVGGMLLVFAVTVLAVGACGLAHIIWFLLKHRKADLISGVVLLILFGMLFYVKTLSVEANKLRVLTEGKFQSCKETALQASNGKGFAWCEERDVSRGIAIDPPIFSAIIYDPRDQILMPYLRRSQEWKAMEWQKGYFSDSYEAKNLIEHYYQVTFFGGFAGDVP